MSLKKSDFLQYLSDVNTRFLSYMNHKETSAWAAVILYFVLTTQTVATLHDFSSASMAVKVFASAFLGFVGVCFIYYVMTQYSLKRTAADVIAACYHLSAECLDMDEKQISQFNLKLPEKSSPKRLQPQSEHFLPECILEKSKEYQQKGHWPLNVIELLCYLLMIATTVVGIFVVWAGNLTANTQAL